ncbi:MAG: DUF3592 domain-containing protein, partial [Planctomycetes bacterium]|nr:DUF3592 domain-containing protein [Planctomycetota bacterium]
MAENQEGVVQSIKGESKKQSDVDLRQVRRVVKRLMIYVVGVLGILGLPALFLLSQVIKPELQAWYRLSGEAQAVVSHQSHESHSNAAGRTYSYYVEAVFNVGGRFYSCTRFLPSGPRGSLGEPEGEKAARYAPGRRVPVHYDPTHPEFCSFQLGLPWFSFFLFLSWLWIALFNLKWILSGGVFRGLAGVGCVTIGLWLIAIFAASAGGVYHGEYQGLYPPLINLITHKALKEESTENMMKRFGQLQGEEKIWVAITLARRDTDSPEVIACLIKNLKHEELAIHEGCVSALIRLGPKASSAVPALTAMLGKIETNHCDPDPLIEALAAIGAAAAKDATALLDSESEWVRQNALTLLQKLEGKAD